MDANWIVKLIDNNPTTLRNWLYRYGPEKCINWYQRRILDIIFPDKFKNKLESPVFEQRNHEESVDVGDRQIGWLGLEDLELKNGGHPKKFT